MGARAMVHSRKTMIDSSRPTLIIILRNISATSSERPMNSSPSSQCCARTPGQDGDRSSVTTKDAGPSLNWTSFCFAALSHSYAINWWALFINYLRPPRDTIGCRVENRYVCIRHHNSFFLHTFAKIQSALQREGNCFISDSYSSR